MLVYGALSLVAIGAAHRARTEPDRRPAGSWLPVSSSAGLVGHVLSLAGGVVLAVGTIKATRQFVQRWGWARALHADLRPAIRHAGEGTIVDARRRERRSARSCSSAACSRRRSGVIASSLAFGLLHQMRGRVRWVWAGWATVMGFLFGALFLATGSLLGPLRRARRDQRHEPPLPARHGRRAAEDRRHLGGLLGRG